MYQEHMCEKWWKYHKRYVLYYGLTIGTMLSAGQVSVFIMTLQFWYYAGPKVFLLYYKNKVPF